MKQRRERVRFASDSPKVLLAFIILWCAVAGCASVPMSSSVRPGTWAAPVTGTGLSNLFRVDDLVYRSEQPGGKEMKELQSLGIKTVVNLRNVKNDKGEAKGTALNLVHITINTWTMSYEDIVNSLNAILSSPQPVVVHCLHGSDRTGCVVAAYRIVKGGWTKEEAIREFLEGGYGYHSGWFPNILRLLQSLDVDRLKTDVEARVSTRGS